MPPADRAKTLLDKYGIWSSAVDNNGVQGCRITPCVFILPKELDTFVKAVAEMATAAQLLPGVQVGRARAARVSIR